MLTMYHVIYYMKGQPKQHKCFKTFELAQAFAIGIRESKECESCVIKNEIG